MKLGVALIVSALMAAHVHGGAAQKEFLALVEGATSVVITRPRDHAVLLTSNDAKQVARAIDVIDIVDPVEERTADGDTIEVLPCFCVADYVVVFVTPSGERQFFVKHGGKAILPPQPLAVSYLTDLKLTKRSATSLRKFVRRLERRPNQSPQRNAGSRPSSDDSPVSETPVSLGPRG